MLNLDPAKLLVIMVLVLVVMGPERMHSSARQLGALWRTATEFREKAEQQVREAMPDLDLPRIPSNPRAALRSYATDLLADHTGSDHTAESIPASADEATQAAGDSFDEKTTTKRAIDATEHDPSSSSEPRYDDVTMN